MGAAKVATKLLSAFNLFNLGYDALAFPYIYLIYKAGGSVGNDTRDYLGGFCLLAGLVLLLAYSGAWRESPKMGIALACCAVILGLVIVRNRLIMLGVSVGTVGVRLLFSTLLKFNGRVLTIGLMLLVVALLIVRKAAQMQRRP